MQLTPAKTRLALVLAEPGPSGGRRIPELGDEFAVGRSTMHARLHWLIKRGIAVHTAGGYKLADDILVSCKGQVYRQLWLLPADDEAATAA